MSFNIYGRLQKGQYILQLKVNWVLEGWDQSDVPLVSYGEDITEMKFCQKISNFQQASILFEAKEKRAEAKPLNPSHPELVALKNKSQAYGYPYLYSLSIELTYITKIYQKKRVLLLNQYLKEILNQRNLIVVIKWILNLNQDKIN